jgi:hypothetical protein
MDIFETAQDLIDHQQHPCQLGGEIPILAKMSDLVASIKKSPSPRGAEAGFRYGTLQELLVHFFGVRRRPLMISHTKHSGLLHDLSGYIQLITTNEKDIETLKRELENPTWLINPKGRAFSSFDLQPIKPTILGVLGAKQVNPTIARLLLSGQVPFILTSGPKCNNQWSRKNMLGHLNDSGLMQGIVYATRIQPQCVGALRTHGHPVIDWTEEEHDSSRPSRRGFEKRFGKPNEVPRKHRRALEATWFHCRAYAREFTKCFLFSFMKPEETSYKNFEARLLNGIDQMIEKHLRILAYLRITPRYITPIQQQILLYLREQQDWKTGRDILRRFTMRSDQRDCALVNLEARGLVVSNGRQHRASWLHEIASESP